MFLSIRALKGIGTFKAILVPRNIVDTFSGGWWMCAVTAVRGDMSKLGARRVNCGGKYRPGQGAEGVMSHNQEQEQISSQYCVIYGLNCGPLLWSDLQISI